MTVATYDGRMPRSGAAARARLREAALELYRDQGYDATTTAAIAARAGVTERTYFRHFPDKREVLFDGEGELFDVMTAAITFGPADSSPLALVLHAYCAAAPLFVAGRPIAQQRARIIATSPALMERAHAKAVALTEAVVAALRERGTSEPTARLAAGAGAAVFERATHAWDGTSAPGLTALVAEATDELRALT